MPRSADSADRRHTAVPNRRSHRNAGSVASVATAPMKVCPDTVNRQTEASGISQWGGMEIGRTGKAHRDLNLVTNPNVDEQMNASRKDNSSCRRSNSTFWLRRRRSKVE